MCFLFTRARSQTNQAYASMGTVKIHLRPSYTYVALRFECLERLACIHGSVHYVFTILRLFDLVVRVVQEFELGLQVLTILP